MQSILLLIFRILSHKLIYNRHFSLLVNKIVVYVTGEEHIERILNGIRSRFTADAEAAKTSFV